MSLSVEQQARVNAAYAKAKADFDRVAMLSKRLELKRAVAPATWDDVMTVAEATSKALFSAWEFINLTAREAGERA